MFAVGRMHDGEHHTILRIVKLGTINEHKNEQLFQWGKGELSMITKKGKVLLDAFGRCATPSNGGYHPFDMERWGILYSWFIRILKEGKR